MKTLDQLNIGDKMMIKNLSKDSTVRRRLLDMGLTPGTALEVTGKAPFGDPIEILVRGYKLSLRKSEAQNVMGE